MLKTKYLVIASIVVAAVVASPLVISQSIDSKIEAKKLLLEKNGLKQEILSKNGYFTTQRTFTLEVVDAKKARDFLLAQLVEKNAQYKLFAQSLKEETDAGINEGMDGLKFQGDMLNSNLIPSDVKISMSLSQLPTSVQNELVNDKEASDIILPLLARGVLAVDMTLGRDGTLKDMKLKDIKEEIKSNGSVLSIDTAKQMLTLNENGGIVQGALGVGKQNLGVNSAMFMLKSELQDFIYNFTYQDDLNNKGDIKIGNYTLEMNDEYSNTKFNLGGLIATSSVEDVKKDLNIKADYTFDNVVVKSNSGDLAVDKFFANLFLRGINADTVKKLQVDYNALLLGTTSPNDKVLIDDFVALVNHGVKLDFGLALKGMNADMLNLKDVSVDTTLEVAQNSYTDKQSPLALIGLLDISSKVKIHKDDRAKLETMGIASAKEFALGRSEGDFFIYEIAMKKGLISVNGQSIQ